MWCVRARSFHEVISVAFAASTWVMCYALQPSLTLARPLRALPLAERAAPVFKRTLEIAAAQTVKMTKRVPMLVKANPERLTLGLAESLMFRGAIKPITFGGKLFLSYKFVQWTKRKSRPVRAASLTLSAREREWGQHAMLVTA